MKACVIGAGIMGRLMALALQESGGKVSIYDHGHSCSEAAAGLLTPISESEKSSPIIYQLGFESLNQYWPELVQKISQPDCFKREGLLVLSHPRDEGEMIRLRRIVDHQFLKQYQLLDKWDLQQLEPQLTHFEKGIYFPEEGYIHNHAFLTALKKHLIEREVNWIPEYVGSIQETLSSYDKVFDCRGLKAGSIFADLRGVRGELIWLQTSDVKIKHPIRLMHPRYSLYIVPRPDDIYIVGASEIESVDESPISVRTLLELLSAVYMVHPGFAEARLIKTVTHCRPTLANHHPKIKYSENYIAINGLYRHGYLIAPALMKEVMRYLETGLATVKFPNLWEPL